MKEMSRRDFMKYIGVAGGSAALVGLPGCKNPEYNEQQLVKSYLDIIDVTAFQECTPGGETKYKIRFLSKHPSKVRKDAGKESDNITIDVGPTTEIENVYEALVGNNLIVLDQPGKASYKDSIVVGKANYALIDSINVDSPRGVRFSHAFPGNHQSKAPDNEYKELSTRLQDSGRAKRIEDWTEKMRDAIKADLDSTLKTSKHRDNIADREQQLKAIKP
jgi:hypothetical protein